MSDLKARREALGLTLRDVEEITSGRVSNAYLSQLESGKIKSPSLAIACALSAVYCVTVEQIAEWFGQDKPKPPAMCPTCGRPLRDRDASLAEDAKRLSGDAVAARAEGIAQPLVGDPNAKG